MDFGIKSWRPANHISLTEKDGGLRADVCTHVGIVEIFSYSGAEYTGPFTSLTCFYDGRTWRGRLDRGYSRRWLSRLAFEFADQVRKRAAPD